MTDTSMVEIGARAYRKWRCGFASSKPADDIDRSLSRDMLKAFRQPTLNQSLLGMAALMKITGRACNPDDADTIWKAMIDAALSET